jgi:hypothetical protein
MEFPAPVDSRSCSCFISLAQSYQCVGKYSNAVASRWSSRGPTESSSITKGSARTPTHHHRPSGRCSGVQPQWIVDLCSCFISLAQPNASGSTPTQSPAGGHRGPISNPVASPKGSATERRRFAITAPGRMQWKEPQWIVDPVLFHLPQVVLPMRQKNSNAVAFSGGQPEVLLNPVAAPGGSATIHQRSHHRPSPEAVESQPQ